MVEPCISVTKERIRAEILMGDTVITKTPFIKSFNVSKSREQVSNTFNVTFEVLASQFFPVQSEIKIKSGIQGSLKTIFTGVVERTSSKPTLGKPSFYLVTLQGRGVLSTLENKKFSRRLKADGQGLFCTITGGPANRPDRYYSLDKNVSSGNHTYIWKSPNPSKKEGENSPLIQHRNTLDNTSAGGLAGAIAGKPTGGTRQGGDGGLVEHTHEDRDEGGPGFGVFAAD